jgi:hypothetical protein
MNPDSGMLYELSVTSPFNDPPVAGATIDAETALREGLIEKEQLSSAQRSDLEDMIERRLRLVAVSEPVVQKLRLGEKELRRRKQRRR